MILSGLFERKLPCVCFVSFVYISVAVGDLIIKRGDFGIPSTGLNLQHFVPIQGRISDVICRGIFMVNYTLYKNAGF